MNGIDQKRNNRDYSHRRARSPISGILMLRTCKQLNLLALPAWLATIVVCLYPLIVLANETAPNCGCHAKAVSMTCCGSPEVPPVSPSCCAQSSPSSVRCCCDNTASECQCDDCQCGNGDHSSPPMPLVPVNHETVDFQSIASLAFPAQEVYAVTSVSDMITYSTRMAESSITTAQETCVFLSRFNC